MNKYSEIPPHTWKRAIGQGWERPYTVRYPSNLDDGPFHGMPLGGFGAGCIGRSSRGDFNLWHIDGGEHVFKNVPGCQFSIFTSGQAYALSTQPPEDNTLQTWQWYPNVVHSPTGAKTDGGTYHALYPRSWFVYENVFPLQFTCEQFSPVWAHNYRETSYPVAVFLWNIHNPTNQPITASIMLSWENMTGWFTNALKSPQVKIRDDGSPVYEYQPRWGESQGNYNWLAENDQYLGCVLGRATDNPIQEGDGTWCIATVKNPQVELFYHCQFNPVGNGEEIWRDFSQNGSLSNSQDETPADVNSRLGAAVAVRFTLPPGETLTVPFVLSWDFPVTEFAAGVNYYRRYTDFFGTTGDNAWQIATCALKECYNWRSHIESWQKPILEREDLPSWFKMALFNELYDLTSGGTLWSAGTEKDPMGQFAVLECLDYRWYESLDVRLYGSFGLLILFPELEKAVIRAFVRAIPQSDDRSRIIGYYLTINSPSPMALRKVAGATPHDLGAPNEWVWEQTNYTSYQDCNLWKDLGCDFVLQVYRDFLFTGADDMEFLVDCWHGIVLTLDYLKQFDIDGDGIPENSGAPDQTFDDWRLSGVSAYCGALWLAALEAAIAICDVLINRPELPNVGEQRSIYENWLNQSSPVYQQKLWNGKFYRLDSESGSNVVMADQLSGQFYARLLNLPDIVPRDRALSALTTIYDACFLKFQDGKFGAANGVLLDGSPENPQATHPLEVWTGINFGLAAFLLQMGMKDQGLRLTEAVVRQVYDHGLQFRTPEAITAAGTFRASTYLRPMAIWAVYICFK
ncbi:GH116 family glycosyl hydrolase [Cylindrospermopsis curvispora]|uniref:Bile acid beta-glucosidase n=1 Tax=Cylindrospermopsis curvispora GIHE-G1 TaxID=2666332 RepID=A0A7H0F0P2_9CYAN|nr:GH116 family glycosyl hydrolase [Cylindrospermopsis curvispora]QNP29608.1 bile acid beta-glucosidase [Cylindrospermopsis curvispora GIHE-G1]